MSNPNHPFMNEDLTTQSSETAEIMRRFNDAFLQHDPGALTALVGEDCIIEGVAPAPNGARYVGREACLELWQAIATGPGHFDLEDVFVAGDRAIIRWRRWWGEGESDSVRGVNLMRVGNGLIVEAMGYVKGQ